MNLKGIKQKVKKIRFFKLLKRSVIFAFLAIILAHILVEQTTKKRIFSSTKDIPKNHVALLLGTNKYVANGNINLYYKYRIDAAVELYKSGKINYIIVSGDNSRKKYNEPAQMRDDLIRKGVPESRIFLDYAGFRTLDSIVRSKEIFGQTKLPSYRNHFITKGPYLLPERKEWRR
jgi:SanA protein